MTGALTALPLTGHAPDNPSIAKHLRELADWIDADDAKELSTVFIVIEYADGSLRRQTCGKPCDLARALGVLQMAIVQGAVK